MGWSTTGAANASRYQYTGRENDGATGLYFYRARYYNPAWGRFISEDPIGLAGGVNLYGYAAGNPLQLRDPSGNDAVPWGPAIPMAVITKVNASTVASIQRAAAVLNTIAQMVSDSAAPSPPASSSGPGAAAPNGGCGCFVAGTLVETDRGLRPIEQIEVGDLVRSRDEVSGRTDYKPVTALIRPHGKRIYEVRLAQIGSERIETFEVTDDHPWKSKAGGWLTTLQLTADAVLQTEDAMGATVVAIAATGRTQDTYNLEVAGFHTYFVGKQKVWVHNACEPRDTRPNKVQNKEARDARKAAERATGETFNKAQQREFHDRITGNQMSFDELVEEAVAVLTGK